MYSGCTDDEFKCTTGNPNCINLQDKCNNILDCEDGSDELNCSKLILHSCKISL